MIILFEENEKSFSTLGLGVLKDALSCVVKEKLNDEFSLTMEYPVKGSNFSKIKNNRIICVKPNPYSEPQAFRIYSVTKAINGKVIVDANHISYDMNSIPIKAFSAKNMQDVLVQIQNGCIIDNPFVLSSDILRSKTYKTTAPYNLRAIIMGSEQSIVTEYNAELEFDNYVVKILSKRGKNRGAVVRYGHNMTDINHVLSTDLLYNGVFPYYHTEKTTTETTTSGEFQQVYIVGSKTFQDGWLSYSKDGEPYHPIDESPVQIATEGEYYQKVYAWNTLYNVYQEKIYNEQVTIIQGLTEPSWLSIDWSHFPNVIVKAARKGYYKKATDTDWGEIKGVGDVVYEGSIVSSGLMENLILSFSEVIPSNNTSSNEEVSEIVDVQLDQPIIWIETNDAKSMLHDRILMLDLTSEFEEEPSQINLRAKAEEYINKHNIGTIKHSTTLSFIDMSSTKEGSRFENLDHVELGDTVKVVYEDAGIEIDLRVISVEYDALSERYNSIELGEKEDKMSDSTIQNGDNVSALTNDVGYATVTTVNKLIANIVTANYIEALNAKLSSAQISQLAVERINCTGIIEASQFAIDSLVAKLLIADNAEIADTLTAGNIKVAGDISINSGQITITSENGTSFVVDREGNLTANSVSITGGNLNINDGVFEVTNDGVLTALAADITGAIRAKEGEIAGFVIQEKQLSYGTIGSPSNYVIVSPGINAEITSLVSGSKTWSFIASGQFGVTTSGTLYAKQAVIDGTITAESGKIAGFDIYRDKLSSTNVTISPTLLSYGDGFSVTHDGKVTITKGSLEIQNGMYIVVELTQDTYESDVYYTKTSFGDYVLSTGAFDPDTTYYQYDGTKKFFGVDSNGNLTANSVKITGGELTIGQSYGMPVFSVDQTGKLTAKSAFISGGSINVSKGEILLGGSYDYIYSRMNFGSGNGHYAYVYLTSSTYEPDTYYTYDDSTQQYNRATGSFDPNATYYRYWEDVYEPNIYYTLENGIYVLSTSETYDSSKTYYKYTGGASFYVRHDGSVEARDLTIYGGAIRISDPYDSGVSFEVTNTGALTATSATITGTINAESGKIGAEYNNFIIGGVDYINYTVITLTSEDYEPDTYYIRDQNYNYILATGAFDPNETYYSKNISGAAYIKSGLTSFEDTQHDGIYIGTDGVRLGRNFTVDNQGNLVASSVEITGGSLLIGNQSGDTIFNVNTDGKLVASSAQISGSVNIRMGEIILGGLGKCTYSPVPEVVIQAFYLPNIYYTLENGKYVLSTSETYDSSKTYYSYEDGADFYVSWMGRVVAKNLTIQGGSISITNSSGTSFKVTNAGALTATNANISGTITASDGSIGSLSIHSDYIGVAFDPTSQSPTYSGVSIYASGLVQLSDIYIKDRLSFKSRGQQIITHTDPQGNHESVTVESEIRNGIISQTTFAPGDYLNPVTRSFSMGCLVGIIPPNRYSGGLCFYSCLINPRTHSGTGDEDKTYNVSDIFDQIYGVWATLYDSSGQYESQSLHVTWDNNTLNIVVHWHLHYEQTAGVSLLILGRVKNSS